MRGQVNQRGVHYVVEANSLKVAALSEGAIRSALVGMITVLGGGTHRWEALGDRRTLS